MKVTLEDHGLLVIDGFLPPEVFGAVSDQVGDSDFESVHARHWDRAWRVWDGAPLRGRSVVYDPANRMQGNSIRYPTRSSIDAFLDAVRALTGRFPGVAGIETVDWDAVFAFPSIYPVGSALSLHRDGGAYSGAFTYFTHPSWGLHWGGELLVFEPLAASAISTLNSIEPDGARWLSEDPEHLSSLSGIATCVIPVPNRLVMLGPDRPHAIRRVDANAGSHVRSTIAGFFLRP